MSAKRKVGAVTSGRKKRKRIETLSAAERANLLWELRQKDAVFELTTPGVICRSKPHMEHVDIQKALAMNYQSLASQVSVLCHWQSTLRFHADGSGAGGGGGGVAGGSTSHSTAADQPGTVPQLTDDDGVARPMVGDLLASMQAAVLNCDPAACVQLLRNSDSPPRFIDSMIADEFWRGTLFKLVRKHRTAGGGGGSGGRRGGGRTGTGAASGGGGKNPFFEYVLTRISFLSQPLGFEVPAELCVDADNRIFQQRLRAAVESVPRCASLAEFRAVRDSLTAFNAKFHSHFFTVMLLTAKCGGRAALGTRRMYEDPVKCLYFRLLQDVRRNALDQLVVESVMDSYVNLSGLPAQVATFFILGAALRQRSNARGHERADMGKIRRLLDGPPGSGSGGGAPGQTQGHGGGGGAAADAGAADDDYFFALALQIRQSGVVGDVIHALCDPFEKNEKLLDPGNRATLCKLCALGSCLLDSDSGAGAAEAGGGSASARTAARSRSLAQSRAATDKLTALAHAVLRSREFVSDKHANDHQDLFQAVRDLVLPPKVTTQQQQASQQPTTGAAAAAGDKRHAAAVSSSSSSSSSSSPLPSSSSSAAAAAAAIIAAGSSAPSAGTTEAAPPVVMQAVLSWVRAMWLSEKHLRVNYALFFLRFVELLHELRQDPRTTQLQLLEVMDIYARAFELQQRTANAESHKNTAPARRLVLVLEMLDMMKDGLSRHVMEFVSSAPVLKALDAQARLAVLRALCRVARPPFAPAFVHALQAILEASANDVLRRHAAERDDPRGIHEQLRQFAKRAPAQLGTFVPALLDRVCAGVRTGASGGGALL